MQNEGRELSSSLDLLSEHPLAVQRLIAQAQSALLEVAGFDIRKLAIALQFQVHTRTYQNMLRKSDETKARGLFWTDTN